MLAAFILSFLANVILALVSLVILPERVAIHFGPGGAPDGWASNMTGTMMMLGVHCLVFCSIYFSPKLLEKAPNKWISLPNREYWLKPENRPQAMEKFRRHMWQFGTALFVFMLFAGALSLKANLSKPIRLDEGPLFIALGVFLAYTAYWTVVLLRIYRIPINK